MEHAPGMEDLGQDEPSSSKERPMTEQNTPEDEGETISIPKEFLQGTEFKPGDELVLKVISSDEEGLQVAYAKAPEKDGAEGEPSDANSEIDQLPNEEY